MRRFIADASSPGLGKAYNNEYVWLTRWNDEGKIVEIRSYFDTMLSEEALADPV